MSDTWLAQLSFSQCLFQIFTTFFKALNHLLCLSTSLLSLSLLFSGDCLSFLHENGMFYVWSPSIFQSHLFFVTSLLLLCQFIHFHPSSPRSCFLNCFLNFLSLGYLFYPRIFSSTQMHEFFLKIYFKYPFNPLSTPLVIHTVQYSGFLFLICLGCHCNLPFTLRRFLKFHFTSPNYKWHFQSLCYCTYLLHLTLLISIWFWKL